MRNFWKRTLALICALILCSSCAEALAEFSPRLAELEKGEGMTVSLRGSLDSLSPLSKQSAAIVNEWLSHLEVLCSVGKSTQAELKMDGETIYALSVQKQSGYTLTSFSPSMGAYLTEPEGKNALELLSGGEGWLDLRRLPELYAALAPVLYPALTEFTAPKLTKEPTSIKNADRAASYENYTFKDGSLNEAWGSVVDQVLPVLRDALADQPYRFAQAEEFLRSIEFSGECRFKRFLDKEGGELGMQFTGVAARGEDKRKVTLFGGYTPNKGGYLSFTLPATAGKNNLKITLSEKLTGKNGTNTLTLEGSYSRTLNGETASGTLDATMKNAVKEDAEHWTGKATVTATRNKEKTTWVLTPDLSFTQAGLEGTVSIQKKSGSKVTGKGAVQMKISAYEALDVPSPASAKDLRGLTEERARAAVLTELAPLGGVVSRLAALLPENDRNHLMHDLRTDEWMNGPTVPAGNESAPDDGGWAVEEDELQ